MDTNTLRNGDLLTWVESLDWDDRATYSSPEYEDGERAVHVRVGVVDLVVSPAARNTVTGEIIWHLSGHTHAVGDEDGARECFAENRRRNEQTEFEATVDPDRAQVRLKARSMGVPDEIIDRMLPLTGDAPLDGVVGQVQAQMARGMPMEAAIHQAASDAVRRLSQEDGPTGFYL